ncbi:glycosyltransferase (GlcNAc), putative [Bodo saltans]|uniref:Glycosyltransferase (GlcNAc), putative n=1 Tax=Bodo saltans TaxID=75058 RepID=A0A0S4IMB2_BODSA|nr:glycosyltransferase (GlcNAc), putative [Bodo saltans]|eukprot:CUE71807.1 glycosyltransferase (GlcNAc), putative [Bodo saltans]
MQPKRRPESATVQRNSAIIVAASFLVAVGVFLFVSKSSPLQDASEEQVRPLIRTGSKRHQSNNNDAVVAPHSAHDVTSAGNDDVLPLIAEVREHLQSVRNRMQDRPGAPQVHTPLSPNSAQHLMMNQHLPIGGHNNGGEEVEDAHSTIFVSIAAFRDVECGPSLEDMFRKAKYPHRIFAGIVDQREPGEFNLCIPQSFRDCQNQPLNSSWAAAASSSDHNNNKDKTSAETWNSTKSTFCPMDNVRTRHTLPNEARGPTFGRFVAQLMYQGEQYYMMIDSHMRFVERWDVRLLSMYAKMPTRGVISHYPSGFEPGFVLESNHDIMFMCYAHFYDGVGILRNGAKNVRNRQKRPVLQPFTAAGFLFGHSDYIFDVPFDPWLDYLFDGEEILYTVRLWTSGWDSYLPSHDIMYHFYGRPKAPKVWGTTNQWVAIQRVSQRRVLHMLKMTKPNSTIPVVDPSTETETRIFNELETYGLGSVRRLEDFWPFAHVDPIKRTSDRGFCDRAN